MIASLTHQSLNGIIDAYDECVHKDKKLSRTN